MASTQAGGLGQSVPNLPQPAGQPAEKQGDYDRLLRLMSKDMNLAIFRRFQEANMRSLLSLQAEIMELDTIYQQRWHSDDPEDSIMPHLKSSYRSFRLSQPPRPVVPSDTSNGGSRDSMEMNDLEDEGWEMHPYDLLEKLQHKLSAYNALLIQATEIEKMGRPPSSQLRTLQHWLYNPGGGNQFLKGSETFTWDSDDASQYVCLKQASSENDLFTRFIKRVMSLIFHRLIGENISRNKKGRGKEIDVEAGITSYDEDTLDKASNIISVVLSSVMPVVTIFALNELDTVSQRLGLTVVFTAAFAGLLAVFSTAKRAEIFAATATFAAVEVVFIGTALGS